ncbi:unnamed protein product, partial [marine sediment metagenome]
EFEWQVLSDNSPTSHGVDWVNLKGVTFGKPSINTWYLVFGWHDSVNNLVGISVNDGVPDTAAFSAGCHDDNAPLWLGRYYNNTISWDGRMDEAGIAGCVLTAEQRVRLYNKGNGRTYPFPSGGQIIWVMCKRMIGLIQELKLGRISPDKLLERYGELLPI